MIPLSDPGQCHLLMIQPRDLLYGVVRALGVVNEVCLCMKRSDAYLVHRKESIDYGSCSSLENAPVYDESVGVS